MAARFASNRDIALSCRIGETTVRGCIRRAELAGLKWPLDDALTDLALEQMLFLRQPCRSPQKNGPYPTGRKWNKQLKRKGVTLQLLVEEFRINHPNAYGYSRCCQLYGLAWASKQNPTMLFEHKAVYKLFVDYAGPSLPIWDPKTGLVTDAQIFVAALGASNYTFAEATLTQTLPDWIGSHIRCFKFLWRRSAISGAGQPGGAR